MIHKLYNARRLIFYSTTGKTFKMENRREERLSVKKCIPINNSPRSWRDFARECFCFGSEAVNTSGKAVRGLVKNSLAGFVREGLWQLCRSPAHESRQLRRLHKQQTFLPR